jgi:replicative DNA helicase
MTVSLEKIFFAYILQNKKYIHIVEPQFFRNAQIQFVYKVLRTYLMKDMDVAVPGPKQIWEMVSMEDREDLVTKESLKTMLTINLVEYDEKNFIIPKLNLFILSNRIKNSAGDIVDEARNLDAITEFDDAVVVAGRIKEVVDQMSNTNFTEDDDLGSDFDEVEHHVQDTSRFKIRSGFETIDHMLGGGWDIQTLNCIMAATNSGKSLWMQNFACRSADLGYDVVYITLEMSERKVMKRMGAMRLRVPINEYDHLSKNQDFIRKRIEDLHRGHQGGLGDDIFSQKPGKIIVKFWAAGTATLADIDFYLQKLREKRGIRPKMVIVDYITLIAPQKGVAGDNLFLKGKHLAEGLRAIGAKHQCPVVTGIQVAKEAWNANDITLEQVPESKAIAETADTFFAIIRTEEMKRQNLYRFKLLKQRDGDFLKSQVKLNLNPKYLTLENDVFLDAV